MKLADLPVRVVRPLGADVEEPDERKRRLQAEAARRWRARHPERVKSGNAARYAANRAQVLAAKRAKRYGPERAAFLELARAANARYYRRKRARRIAEGWRPDLQGFTTFTATIVAARRRALERRADSDARGKR